MKNKHAMIITAYNDFDVLQKLLNKKISNILGELQAHFSGVRFTCNG